MRGCKRLLALLLVAALAANPEAQQDHHLTIDSTATPTAQRRPSEAQLCRYTNDGRCDEPDGGTGYCPSGSDSADCDGPNARPPSPAPPPDPHERTAREARLADNESVWSWMMRGDFVGVVWLCTCNSRKRGIKARKARGQTPRTMSWLFCTGVVMCLLLTQLRARWWAWVVLPLVAARPFCEDRCYNGLDDESAVVILPQPPSEPLEDVEEQRPRDDEPGLESSFSIGPLRITAQYAQEPEEPEGVVMAQTTDGVVLMAEAFDTSLPDAVVSAVSVTAVPNPLAGTLAAPTSFEVEGQEAVQEHARVTDRAWMHRPV